MEQASNNLHDVVKGGVACKRQAYYVVFVFFFQAEDGIRDAQESRGLGDVYKRQVSAPRSAESIQRDRMRLRRATYEWISRHGTTAQRELCLLYTSDAADDLICVDLGGRRIIKKKNEQQIQNCMTSKQTSQTTTHTTSHTQQRRHNETR